MNKDELHKKWAEREIERNRILIDLIETNAVENGKVWGYKTIVITEECEIYGDEFNKFFGWELGEKLPPKPLPKGYNMYKLIMKDLRITGTELIDGAGTKRQLYKDGKFIDEKT